MAVQMDEHITTVIEVKTTRKRRWNDRAYKNYIATCARERGVSVPRLYRIAEIDPTNHNTEARRSGRSIEQILAIADAAQKDPALFIAAGTLSRRKKDRNNKRLAQQAIEAVLMGEKIDILWDPDRAKLAVMASLAHSLLAILPEEPTKDDKGVLLEAVLQSVE
jgi:hypothetical protein